MHEYTVELRICGKELDPAAVTADFNLQPTQVRRVGEEKGKAKRWEEAMWSYDGFKQEEKEKSWDSLDEALVFIVRKFWPLRDKLEEYKQRHKVILWCGHFQSSFDGGPTLSPATLKMLGEFGAELFIDNYFPDPGSLIFKSTYPANR